MPKPSGCCFDGQAETEIGYRLSRPHGGRGYATEAAAAVRDYAFNILCLPRVISIIDPRNTASIRVAEKIGLGAKPWLSNSDRMAAFDSLVLVKRKHPRDSRVHPQPKRCTS